MPDPNINLQALLAEAAQRYNPNVAGVDFADLLRRVMLQESGGNVNSISSAGAIGPMQLMPGTARELGVDPYNPRQNIFGGARYLAQGVAKYGVPGGLRYYNAGNPNATYPETNEYVRRILGGTNLGALPTGSSRPGTVRASTGGVSGGAAPPSSPAGAGVPPNPYQADIDAAIQQLKASANAPIQNPFTTASPELNQGLGLAAGTTPLQAEIQAAQVTGPNQFDLQALQAQAEQARNQVALAYLQGHPLPQATFNPIAGGPTPTHEQVPIPERGAPQTDLAGTIIGALGGLIAPQAAGYFAAAPLQAATAAADQQYRDNLLRYQLATEQANTRFSDQELAYQQALNDAVRNEAERQRVEGINQGRDITSIQAGLEPTAALAGGKTLLDPTTGLPALAAGAQKAAKAGSTLGIIQDYVKSATDLATKKEAHDIKLGNLLEHYLNIGQQDVTKRYLLGQGDVRLQNQARGLDIREKQGNRRLDILQQRADQALDHDTSMQETRRILNLMRMRSLGEAHLDPQQKGNLKAAQLSVSQAKDAYLQANRHKFQVESDIAENRISQDPITIGGETHTQAYWERQKAYQDANNAKLALDAANKSLNDFITKLPTQGPGANVTLPNTTGTTNPPANPGSAPKTGPKTPPAGPKPPAGNKKYRYDPVTGKLY